MSTFLMHGNSVNLRRPTPEDRDMFLAAMLRSRELHHPWVFPPTTSDDFAAYLARRDREHADGFLAFSVETEEMTGVVNLNEIVHGCFLSAYLGYYAVVPHAGHGYMREALSLVIRYAFDKLGLHRLEANIQPENAASIALARGCGFRKEGFSPRYLFIDGAWRDHERWAILADQEEAAWLPPERMPCSGPATR